MATQTKLILFFIISIFILAGCASQIAPGGGPIDRTPPEITEIYPPNGTVNFKENYFAITFSEWVEKRSVQDAIFISPPLQKGFDYNWSGKSLEVDFKDTLRPNTTYSVTIGASVEDVNNRNKMIQPVTFAFSTGSQIDSGKISGKVYSDNPSGAMVFAYKKDSVEIDPSVTKPEFISQIGKNGKYELVGLANGNYNVYTFRDKYRDFLYQKNEDEYGVQSKELILRESTNKIDNTDFFLNIEDTIKPSISNIYMKDRNHFIIEFSEPIDSTKILASNFYLYDSTSSKKIEPKYFYRGDATANKYYLAIADTLIPENRNYLFGGSFYDKSSNKSSLEGNPITVKIDKDTTAPKLLKIGGTLPEDKIDYDAPIISVKFDDGFEQGILKNAIEISDAKKDLIPFDILTHDDSWFDIRIQTKLKPRTEYDLQMDLSKIIDAVGNKIDSVYKKKIFTINDLDFSGVSGSIANAGDTKRIYVVLQSADGIKKSYKERTDKSNNFDIQKVLPGKYLLWSFKDKNNNGTYDYGKVKPFQYSEEFIFYPDTLNLRARWPVGDIKIDYK